MTGPNPVCVTVRIRPPALIAGVSQRQRAWLPARRRGFNSLRPLSIRRAKPNGKASVCKTDQRGFDSRRPVSDEEEAAVSMAKLESLMRRWSRIRLIWLITRKSSGATPDSATSWEETPSQSRTVCTEVRFGVRGRRFEADDFVLGPVRVLMLSEGQVTFTTRGAQTNNEATQCAPTMLRLAGVAQRQTRPA